MLHPQHIFCLRPPAFDKHWAFPRILHQRRYDRTISRCVAVLKIAHVRMVGSYPRAFRVVKNGRCEALVDILLVVSHDQYGNDTTNWVKYISFAMRYCGLLLLPEEVYTKFFFKGANWSATFCEVSGPSRSAWRSWPSVSTTIFTFTALSRRRAVLNIFATSLP